MDSEHKTFTPQPRTASVHLIITTPGGSVLGMTGGPNPHLAALLSARANETESPVRKVTSETLQPLGQDSFEVSREFVCSICGGCLDMTWAEIQSFLKILPSVGTFTFVISY